MAANLRYNDLPMPSLKGAVQMQNAASAIIALHTIKSILPVGETAITQGLEQASVDGRFGLIHCAPDVFVDVAHNPQAAQALHDTLLDLPIQGNTHVVIAMLADKATKEVVKTLSPQVDSWFSAGLDVPRGLSAEYMSKAVTEQVCDVKLCACENVAQACEQVMAQASENDRVIVLGSFYTVKEAQLYFLA